MPTSLSRRLALVLAVAAPAVVLRVAGLHGPAAVALLAFGAAVLAASFLLAWAAEAVQKDISGGLAIAILAFIAVLPEYAVDLYFAYTAGHKPEFAQYAAANMTGANRLLLGLGWPVVAFIGIRALAKRRGQPVRRLVLHPRRRVELAFLGVAALLAFVMPVTAEIHVALAAALLLVFAAYLWRVARGDVTEPELIGTPATIAAMPRRRRRWTVAALFTVAALVIVASAEPFANALVDTGGQLGIDRFLLVQWLAPLASEAPEFVVAILLARRGNADDALGTLLSSKVNQWTLLIGTLPFAYLLGGGGAALHLDARQVEEVLLTATQTAFGFAILARLRFDRRAAAALFALFAVQFVIPGTTARLGVSAAYGALAVVLLIVHRSGLQAIARELRLHIIRRAGVTLVGIVLLVAGVVMLAAPGPGLIVIALGLLVLGTEYEWARRRFETTRRRAEELAERAVARPHSLAGSTVLGLGMVGLGVALGVDDELPLSGLSTGISVGVGGAIVLATLGYAVVHARRAVRR